VTREAQDRWALRSQERFAAAQAAGHFKSQIVPVEVPGKKGPTVFDTDEANRPETTLETLARLKPAFRTDGTITAGNAPGLNDGAAAVVLADAAWADKRGLAPTARLVYGLPLVSGETCTVLVHAHDRRVDHLDGGIMGGSERVNDPAPDPGTTPAHKAVVVSGVGTEGDR
jgi:hypothetical protein